MKNGDPWLVQTVHDDGALTVTHRGHGGRVTLPADYVAAHVQLDYARTIHRAQGATVEVAHLLVDPAMAREDLYVGVSRARTGTHLYVAIATDPGEAHPPEVAGSTRQVLTSILDRTGVEPTATETVRAAVAGIGDLRRMASEYEYATRHPCRRPVPDRCRAASSGCHRRPGLAVCGAAAAAGRSPRHRPGPVPDRRGPVRWLRRRPLHRPGPRLPPRQAPHQDHSRTGWPAAGRAGLAGTGPTHRPGGPWDTYLPARYAEMDQRISTLVTEAGSDRPGWWTRLSDHQTSPVGGRRPGRSSPTAPSSTWSATTRSDPDPTRTSRASSCRPGTPPTTPSPPAHHHHRTRRRRPRNDSSPTSPTTNATPGTTTTAAPTDPAAPAATSSHDHHQQPHRERPLTCPAPTRSDHQQPPKSERVEDLPLILEQLLDQLDDLQQTVEAQQRLIAVLTSRVTALEHQPHHD